LLVYHLKQDKSIYILHIMLDYYYNILLILFRKYTVDYKLETYMKIARLYLEDDDPMLAESYINRASLLQVHFKY
jgi:hypothetical protein